MSAVVAYQASDLQRKSREILDQGRSRQGALIRDKDGLLLTVSPKEDADRRERIMQVALSAYSVALQLVESDDGPLSIEAPLAWCALLSPADRRTFLRELGTELQIAASGGRLERLDELLYDWRVSAEMMQDEVLVADLTADLDDPPNRVL